MAILFESGEFKGSKFVKEALNGEAYFMNVKFKIEELKGPIFSFFNRIYAKVAFYHLSVHFRIYFIAICKAKEGFLNIFDAFNLEFFK